MPASQTSSRVASRVALRKYFAIARGEDVRRLVPVVPGRDAEGVVRRRAHACAYAERGRPASRRPRAGTTAPAPARPPRPRAAAGPVRRPAGRPRLAASIAPGPPPVAVTTGAARRRAPRRAASAYAASPRWTAWPPITPDQRMTAGPGGQCGVDRVVVQHLGQHLGRPRGRACPEVRPRVEGGGVQGAVVELVGGVERGPLEVEADQMSTRNRCRGRLELAIGVRRGGDDDGAPPGVPHAATLSGPLRGRRQPAYLSK